MADIYFQCRCGQSMAIEEHGVGRIARCVACGARVPVPVYEIEFECEQCGSTMLAPLALGGSALKCVICGRQQTAPEVAVARLWPKDSPPAVAAEVLAEAERPDAIPPPAARGRMSWLWLMPVFLALAFYAGVRLAPKLASGPRTVAAQTGGVIEVRAELARARSDRTPAADKPRGDKTVLPPEQTVAGFKADGLPIQDRDWPRPPVPTSNSREGRLQEKTDQPPAAAQEEKALLSAPPGREGTNQAMPGLQGAASAGKSNGLLGAAASGPARPPADKTFPPAPAAPRGADMARLEQERKKEWSEIAATCAALDKLKRSGGRSEQSAEFLAAVAAARQKIAAYTEGNANRELDSLGWGLCLQWIYTYTFCREAATFEEAWRLFGEGLGLLEDADSEDETIKADVKMEWMIAFANAWMTSRPEACAGLLDEFRRQIGVETPTARSAWAACEPWLEIRLLKNAAKVDSSRRAAFVEERSRHLLAYFARTGIAEERRIRALKSWIVNLDACGYWAEASKTVESFRAKDGRAPAIPNWHLARLWLALYGEGDWKKARETARALAVAQPGERTRETRSRRNVFEVYYSRMFSPGHELQRQGAARVNEYLKGGRTS